MTWAQGKRIEYIAARLAIEGCVNRADLIDKFVITKQTAAATFRLFERERPGVMRYDMSRKAYVAAEAE
jgi:hypothetical protein